MRLRFNNAVGIQEIRIIYVLLLVMCLFSTTESTDYQAMQLKISTKAKQEYEKYQVETCRKNNTQNAITAYLSWEELCFLKELRTTLFPETSNGEYESLLAKPDGAHLMKQMGYRMMNTAPRSICKKKNLSEDISVDKLKETHNFEDTLFNVIWAGGKEN